ncbi:MAG: calcium-binding protein [Microvirga sp.]
MDQLDFYNLFAGTVTSATSNYLKVEYDSHSYVEFFASGVNYSSSGAPVSGVITGMREVAFGPEKYTRSGASTSAPYFYSLALSGSTETAKEAVLSGADRVLGTNFADYFQTYAGSDVLNGGGGRDTLIGGKGNDVYYVNTRGDSVIEEVRQGRDTVIASATYSLGDNVEILKTSKASARTKINLTGNDLNNTITGNAGANKIDGGEGNDILKGGKGHDTFVFDLDNTGVDIIRDFSVRDDTIAIRDDLGDLFGSLNPANFAIGAAATTSPTVVYDPQSGLIWFDRDGSQVWEDVQYLARVKPGLALTAADFVFI